MTGRKTLFVLALSSLVLFACDDGGEEKINITQQEITAGMETNLEANVIGLAESAKFLNSSDVAVNSASASTSIFDSLEPIETTDTTLPDGEGGGDDLVDLDFTDEARELVDMLMQEIFIDSNIVESSSTSVTYGLNPDNYCISEYDDSVDQDCVSMLEQYNPRFKVSSVNAGDLDIELIIGASNRSPLKLEVYQAHLALEVDLGDLKAVLEDLAADAGEEVEMPSMKGRIKVQIEKQAEQVFALSLGVTEAVEVSMEGLEFNIAKASEAMKMTVDGAAQTIEYSVNWGAIEMTIPGEFFESSSEVCSDDGMGGYTCYEESDGGFDGMAELALAGLSGSFTLDAAAETLQLKNLSIGDGPAYFRVDGQDVYNLEINKDTGRSFDLTITPTEDGEVEIAIMPSLEILLGLHMQVMQDLLEEEDDSMEDWMLNNNIGIGLTGNPVIRSHSQGLMLTSGSFSMWSNEGSFDITGPACIFADDESEASDPVSAMTSAAECPAVEEPTPAP